VLTALATILSVVCGMIYSSHRIASIVIFGLAVLVTDIGACLFWVQKTGGVMGATVIFSIAMLVPTLRPVSFGLRTAM
jgi:hypothetical protein